MWTTPHNGTFISPWKPKRQWDRLVSWRNSRKNNHPLLLKAPLMPRKMGNKQKKQQLGKPLIFSSKRPNPGISWGSHTISGFPAGCGESCHSTTSWPIFFQVWDSTMAVSAWHQRESRCDALPTQRSPVIRAVEQRTCHWNSDESIDIQVVWSWNHHCCFGSPYKLDLVDIRRLYCGHRRHSWALSCHCYMDHPTTFRPGQSEAGCATGRN